MGAGVSHKLEEDAAVAVHGACGCVACRLVGKGLWTQLWLRIRRTRSPDLRGQEH
jgi:hypothetical protein